MSLNENSANHTELNLRGRVYCVLCVWRGRGYCVCVCGGVGVTSVCFCGGWGVIRYTGICHGVVYGYQAVYQDNHFDIIFIVRFGL